MRDINYLMNSISKSKFRNSFHLKEKDILYIKEKGLDKIEEHAYDFLNKRIKPAVIPNDGKQTPMRGHPIFIGQHACACCCRGCVYKWHHFEMERELTNIEIDYLVKVLMTWVKLELERYDINDN